MPYNENDPRKPASHVPFWEEAENDRTPTGDSRDSMPRRNAYPPRDASPRDDRPGRNEYAYRPQGGYNGRPQARGNRTSAPPPPRRRGQEPPRPENTPIWKLVVMDAAILGVSLVVFALFHHVLPSGSQKSGRALPTVSVTAPATVQAATTPAAGDPSATGSSDATTPAATSLGGLFGDKFADKFNADGSVDKTDTTYKSGNINLTLNKVEDKEKDLTYYTIDVYIRDLKYFKTAFANDTFGRGNTGETVDIANAHNAIAAISGDYCANHASGLVIRNGELFREELSDQDVLVMFQDGSMETYSRRDLDLDAVIARGPYQSWAFGPMLLDANGQPMTEFNSNVNRANPRSAIGYYEPGHYVFLLVDGRQEGYSLGMTTEEMSQLFYDMGCKVAYNLDGGQSAVMTYNGAVANKPYNGGRSISDIIYITDEDLGGPMKFQFRDILPHGAIILSLMMVVFYILDQFNDAMAFINNRITKSLLLILSIVSIINAIQIIAYHRRHH